MRRCAASASAPTAISGSPRTSPTRSAAWRRTAPYLPGPLTAELPEGDDYPVGNVNFAESEAFCRKLESLGVTFDVPYKKDGRFDGAILTDPWGTQISLTEGLRVLALPRR